MAGPAECNIGRGDSPGPIGGREDYVGTGNLAVPSWPPRHGIAIIKHRQHDIDERRKSSIHFLRLRFAANRLPKGGPIVQIIKK